MAKRARDNGVSAWTTRIRQGLEKDVRWNRQTWPRRCIQPARRVDQ